jgi:uncharacterized protein
VRHAEGDHAGDQNGSDGVPADANIIVGQALYQDSRGPLRSDEHDCAAGSVSPRFNERSGACLTRSDGNDQSLRDCAVRNAQALCAGYTFVVVM